MRRNITEDTDFYKTTHYLQRPGNITFLHSYGEPREGGKDKEICFFGLQPHVQEHLLQKVTDELIDEGEEDARLTAGVDYFPRKIWERVRDLGYFPLKIKTVPEGTILEEGNVCFTMESTEPWFANMLSHFEDILMWAWYSSAVCTRSMNIKRKLIPIFQKTSDISDLVLPVAVNDFGLRGAQGFESAIMGGMGHLVHFRGSDNMPASRMIKDFYGYKGRALSVWATEHSVATAYGSGAGELEYIKAQLLRAPDEAIISIVIDSYDADNFMQNVAGDPEIVELVKAKTGRVVFRPDSGDPLTNVCKYSDMLGGIYGFNINSRGYKVISHNVGLIQGDGMTEESIPKLYEEYVKTRWAADNIVTGSGGGLLTEGLTRDTQRWAIKASYGEKEGVPFNIQKTPKSDMTKASKAGLLKLASLGRTKYMTIESSKETPVQFNGYVDSLRVLYENGNYYPDTFDNILERATIK